MGPRILAFRPAVVVDRLPARSAACPLSLRDLLRAAGDGARPFPIVRAPFEAVARAALVAAREADAVIGLWLPPGTPAEPWFRAVAGAADEIAAGLPFFVSTDVTVAEGSAAALERAVRSAWQLVDAGVTHLSIDVQALPPSHRARAFAAVAAPATERGAAVDLAVPFEQPPGALVGELERAGRAPDAIGVRCPTAATPAEARAQVVRLVRLCAELRGLPVLRRGPVSAELLEEAGRSPLRGCEDGGAAAHAAASAIPPDEVVRRDGEESRASALGRAAAALPREAADRLEARAYVEVAALIERLGAAGSATPVAGALERLLEER